MSNADFIDALSLEEVNAPVLLIEARDIVNRAWNEGQLTRSEIVGTVNTIYRSLVWGVSCEDLIIHPDLDGKHVLVLPIRYPN